MDLQFPPYLISCLLTSSLTATTTSSPTDHIVHAEVGGDVAAPAGRTQSEEEEGAWGHSKMKAAVAQYAPTMTMTMAEAQTQAGE